VRGRQTNVKGITAFVSDACDIREKGGMRKRMLGIELRFFKTNKTERRAR